MSMIVQNPLPRSGGHVIVEQLKRSGIGMVFCVPGESHLDVLDGLFDAKDTIRVLTCRHEAAAANMAVAYGKLTGRPGVCLVGRGPGATHAAVGIHIADQDSTPMLLLVGQVPRAHLGRGSFQEIDYKAVFGSMARWVGEATEASELPELMRRALHYATSGRQGPAVLSVPEDVSSSTCYAEDLPPITAPVAEPAAEALSQVDQLLATAERPIVIVGGGGWTDEVCEALREVCEARQLPVAAAFRSQDVLDNRSPCYAGNLGVGATPGLAAAVQNADVVIAIGTRIDEMTAGAYATLTAPCPQQHLVHVFPDPNELGHVFSAEVAIPSTPGRFLNAWRTSAPTAGKRRGWMSQLHTAYLAGREGSAPGPIDLAAVVRHVSDVLPEDGIVTNGAGNYTAWVHRYFQFKRPSTQLAPIAGAMGFGVPAAVAAKAVHPDRTVVCFAGDGCFMMSGQELATAMQYDLPIVVIVINNNSYGTIQTHQEKRYPGRPVGVALRNPDFVKYAQSFGAHAERVTATEQFGPAFERACTARVSALLELTVDASLRLGRE